MITLLAQSRTKLSFVVDTFRSCPASTCNRKAELPVRIEQWLCQTTVIMGEQTIGAGDWSLGWLTQVKTKLEFSVSFVQCRKACLLYVIHEAISWRVSLIFKSLICFAVWCLVVYCIRTRTLLIPSYLFQMWDMCTSDSVDRI